MKQLLRISFLKINENWSKWSKILEDHTWTIPSTEKRWEALKFFQNSSWSWPGSAMIMTMLMFFPLSMTKSNLFSRAASAGLVCSIVFVDTFVSEICRPLSIPVTSVFGLEVWSTVIFWSVSNDGTTFQVAGIFTRRRINCYVINRNMKIDFY